MLVDKVTSAPDQMRVGEVLAVLRGLARESGIVGSLNSKQQPFERMLVHLGVENPALPWTLP
jgi:hypothetical protein